MSNKKAFLLISVWSFSLNILIFGFIVPKVFMYLQVELTQIFSFWPIAYLASFFIWTSISFVIVLQKNKEKIVTVMFLTFLLGASFGLSFLVPITINVLITEIHIFFFSVLFSLTYSTLASNIIEQFFVLSNKTFAIIVFSICLSSILYISFEVDLKSLIKSLGFESTILFLGIIQFFTNVCFGIFIKAEKELE